MTDLEAECLLAVRRGASTAREVADWTGLRVSQWEVREALGALSAAGYVRRIDGRWFSTGRTEDT